MQKCKAFKVTILIAILSSSQLFSMGEADSKEESKKVRSETIKSLLEDAQKATEFYECAHCLADYFSIISSANDFSWLSFSSEFKILFESLQKLAVKIPISQEEIKKRWQWNYDDYPWIVAQSKTLKRKIKERRMHSVEFEFSLLAIDRALQQVKQFNKCKPHPEYGIPQLQ